MSIGMKLRALRQAKKKTLNQAAADLNITKSALAMYERDERVPRDEVKVRISRYYGEPLESLFFEQSEHYKCTATLKDPTPAA